MTNKINFTDVDPIQAKNISIIKNNINKIILKKDFILGKSVKMVIHEISFLHIVLLQLHLLMLIFI